MRRPPETPSINASVTCIDHRITPQYYVDTDLVSDPVIFKLLESCPTIFDIKRTMVDLLADRLDVTLHKPSGVIEPGATVYGKVIVAAGAVIAAGAVVTGPVLVCPGAVIAAGALVRDNSIIGPKCQVGFGAEVTRSLLTGGVFMKHTSFVGDSVLGLDVNIGVFCATTGLRCISGQVVEPATEEVTAHLDGERIGTGYTKFGAVVGDQVTIPAGTVLQPATLIGAGSVLYPKAQLGGFFPIGSQGR